MPDQTALLSAIDAYSDQAYGSDNDDGELSMQRALALDAYSGRVIDAAPEGRSQVSDRAVFETVQWIMPSMMRIFAAGDNVVEFDPVGPEDEEVAEQESDYLNYMVTQKNDWDLTAREWMQDALITKNAYCLVDMEEKLTPEVERYEGQREEQLALLVEDDVEVVGQKQYDDPDDEGTLIDPMSGEPIDPQDQASMAGAMALYHDQAMEPVRQFRQLYDVEIKKVKAQKQLRFDVLPAEHCKIAKDCKDFTLTDCNYFEYWDPDCTISDLRALGYDVEDDIPDGQERDTEEDDARSDGDESDFDTPDPTMRKVTCRTIWIRHDYDGDGIAELQRVIRVGQEILDHEPASRIPVACIVPFINTHRHLGNSVADLVFDIQRIKTSLLRSGLDSLQLASRPRHVISQKVTLDDMLVSRSGGLVRLKDGAIPGEGHVMPLPTENTFPFAQQGLQHMDTVTEARVGVNRMFMGIDASNLNDHNRVGQLSTMAAQRIEDIARLFGTGYKRLFSLAHELIIKNGVSADKIKLRGKWVDLDPTQWRTGRDMRITAPFAAGNKDSLVQRIMIHMQVHEKALAAGLPIVDPNNAYNLALELAKATDLQGTKIYTDPSTVEPKPPGPDYTMLALEIENKKADNAAKDSQADAEMSKYQADIDAQVKELTARINSETQIALAQIKEGQSINLERFKADRKAAEPKPDFKGVTNELKSITENASKKTDKALEKAMGKLAEAVETMGAEKEVVRDDKGKVKGTRIKRNK